MSMSTILPVPARPTQPGCLSFDKWRELYAVDIDSIAHYTMMRLSDLDAVSWDLGGLRSSLERHLYRTSASRFKSFVQMK